MWSIAGINENGVGRGCKDWKYIFFVLRRKSTERRIRHLSTSIDLFVFYFYPYLCVYVEYVCGGSGVRTLSEYDDDG